MGRDQRVQVREARKNEAELLAQMGAKTFHETFAADNRPEDMEQFLREKFGPRQQAEELEDPAARFFIAEVNGEPAGYAKLEAGTELPGVSGEDPVELERIYVLRAFLGHGVGAALMSACLEQARALGHDVLCLGVWERNLRAREFYQRWGFAEVGRHVFLLGSDRQTDLVLERSLGPD